MTGNLKTEYPHLDFENLNETSELHDVYSAWKQAWEDTQHLSDAEIFAGDNPAFERRRYCDRLATHYRVTTLADFAMKTAMTLDSGAVCIDMAKSLEQDALRILQTGADEEIDWLFSIWCAIRDCSERAGDYSDEVSDDVFRLANLIDDRAAMLRPVTAAGLARKVSMSLGLDMLERTIVASARNDLERLSGGPLRF